MQINIFLFTLIHQGAGHYALLDRFFVILTSYVSYGVVALVLIHLFFISPFRTQDARERLKRFGRGVEAVLSLFIVWVMVWTLKVLVALPRPFVSIPDITPLIHAAPFESFPSSHAAFTMAIAIAVLPYRKHLGHLLIAFSFVIALSRLYVGVHYPFDVGVGLLIGFFIPKLVHRVFKKPSL
jgi:undecaprenyl-diphosphatase